MYRMLSNPCIVRMFPPSLYDPTEDFFPVDQLKLEKFFNDYECLIIVIYNNL